MKILESLALENEPISDLHVYKDKDRNTGEQGSCRYYCCG